MERIDWTTVLVAAIAAVPATLAAYNAHRTHQETKTSNGRSAGQIIESTERKVEGVTGDVGGVTAVLRDVTDQLVQVTKQLEITDSKLGQHIQNANLHMQKNHDTNIER